MFMKLLDDNQLKAEANAAALGVALKERVFKDGVCVISEESSAFSSLLCAAWAKMWYNIGHAEIETWSVGFGRWLEHAVDR